MGKRGLGTVLELGPEGNMGPRHMALLRRIYSSEAYGTVFGQIFVSVADIFVHMPSDVLVGSELSAYGPG